jgi:hypothetical protein
LALAAAIVFATARADDQRILNSLGPEGDWSWVTAANYSSVIVSINAMRTNKSLVSSYGKEAFDGALITLNDPATVQQYVDQYHSGNITALNVLQTYGREQVINDLAPDLNLPESSGKQLGDVLLDSQRDGSMFMIIDTVQKSKVLQVATRVWARETRHLALANPNEWAEKWRAWWTKNSRAMLAHEFQDANWLPENSVDLRSAGPEGTGSDLITSSSGSFNSSAQSRKSLGFDSPVGWRITVVGVSVLGLLVAVAAVVHLFKKS